MTQYIGEKVRDLVLSSLPWISRSAGLTEPVMGADGLTYPGARPFGGQPCEGVGDYVNMAPQEGESALAFMDWDGDIRRVYSNSRLFDFETFFRVVVWMDGRKINISSGDVAIAIQAAIVAGVRAASYNTDGLMRTKAMFDALQVDPAKIWARYTATGASKGIFLLPYESFAIRFRLIGRMVPECFTGTITADLDAC